MADITTSGSQSLDGAGAQWVARLSGFVAGQALLAAAPCYISGSQVLMSGSGNKDTMQCVGVAGSLIRCRCDGFTPIAYASGEPVTLFLNGARFSYYSTALDSGSPLYVGTAAGKLSVTPVVAGDQPVARVLDGTDIVVCMK